MKLTLPQKIALALSVLWLAVNIVGGLHDLDTGASKGFVSFFVFAMIPPLFVLWISGALKPLVKWFKGAE